MIVFTISLVALFILITITFVHAHTKMRVFKAQMERDTKLVNDKISIDTSINDKTSVISPVWMLLFLPVLFASWGIALFGYHYMPARIPTHYGITAVDSWNFKSWISVLSPVLITTVISIILLICCMFIRRAPASVRGNPDAAPEYFRYRKYMIILSIFLGIIEELSCLLIEVGFIVSISPLLLYFPLILVFVMLAVILYIYFRFVRKQKPKGDILDDDTLHNAYKNLQMQTHMRNIQHNGLIIWIAVL